MTITISSRRRLSRIVAVSILTLTLHFSGLQLPFSVDSNGIVRNSFQNYQSAAPGVGVDSNRGDAAVGVFSPSNSSHNVAICVIVYNETLYMDEWVDFHIALGFSPIYIYDNSLDFELMHGEYGGRSLSWYETRRDVREYVRLIHFPEDAVQQRAYHRCIQQDAKNSTYVALIDADEFLVLKTTDNVVDFMDEYCDERCGELSVNWREMGTSNETGYRPGPLLRRNVHGDPRTSNTIKVIVRPAAVAYEAHWRHSVKLNDGYDWVDTNGKVIRVGGWKRQVNIDGPHDVAELYHFAFRSTDEFHHKKCVRGFGRVDGRVQTPQCSNPLYYKLLAGTVFDDAAWRQLTRMVPKYRRWSLLRKN